MARLFWLGLGAAAGVYAVRRVGKAAQAYTPAGVADGLSDFGDGLRELAAAVREGMAEPEASAARLDAESARALLDDPTGRRAERDFRAR